MADPPPTSSDLVGAIQYAVVKIAYGSRGNIVDVEFPTPFPVRYSDGTNALTLDPVQKSFPVIDILHHEIHAGCAFCTGHIFVDVAADGTADMLIQVGANKNLHITSEVAAGAQAFFEFFEGTTFSAAGTGLTPGDQNRVTANSSDATVTHTPTVTAAGTLLGSIYVPGAGNAMQGGGSSAAGRNEKVLAVNTNYLLRVTNKGVGVAHCSISACWYEEAP